MKIDRNKILLKKKERLEETKVWLLSEKMMTDQIYTVMKKLTEETSQFCRAKLGTKL